jgi:hypothetical protein
VCKTGNAGSCSSGNQTGLQTFTVVGNTPPAANNQSVTTNEDTAKAITLSATDADSNALTYTVVSGPGHGTLSGTAPNLTYTPAANYNGSDSFTFKANDGQADSNVATVAITVNAVNDAPSFTKGADQTVVVNAGAQTIANWATNISAGPVDESGQTLTFIATNNNNALFAVQPAISSNGTLTYTPTAGATGTATVTVQLQDNGGVANGGQDTSAAQTFTITVNAANTTTTASAATATYADASVTLSAVVASVAGTVSQGTVTFTVKSGNTVVGAATSGNVTNGQASVSYSLPGGAPAGSYTIEAVYNGSSAFNGSSDTTKSLTVTAKPVTGNFTVDDKVYDGNTTATIIGRSLTGVVGTDDVHLSGGTAAFADKNVGSSKTVTGSGFSLSGAAAGNYTLASVATTTASITAKNLTIGGAVAQNKAYDGTTTATVDFSGASLVGVVGSDAVSINGSSYVANFDTKNVGTGKPVTVTGVTLSGTDAGNYTISQPSGLKADITASSVTVSGITAGVKVYDGGTAATLNTSAATLDGVAAGDKVNLVTSSATGSFADKNVGQNKPVTVTGLSLAGDDAANYTITAVSTVSASITTKGLTVSFTAANKIYDGTTTAMITGSSVAGVVSSDDVSLSGGTATFSDASAGTGKTVTGSGFSLSGVDASNYMLDSSTLTTTADITAKGVTITPNNGQSKTYGEADPALTYTITSGNLVGSDAFTGSLTRDAGENVGTYTIALGSLSAGGNYSLVLVSTPVSFSITPRAIEVTADPQSKIYGDGDPALTYKITSGNLVGSDAFAGSLTRDAGKNVGQYNIKQGSLTAGNNYTLAYVGANLTINKATLTVTADNGSKTYGDSNPAFTVSYAGFKNGETLETSGVISSPSLTTVADNTSAIGNYTITAAQGTLSALNYAFVFQNGTLTITPAPLTVTANDSSKVYGTTGPATPFSGSVSGIKNNDPLTATYASAEAANAATVVATYPNSIIPTLVDNNTGALKNYSVTVVKGTLTVTPASLTVTVNDANKTYGDLNPAFSVSYDGFVLGQDEHVLGGSLGFMTGANQSSAVGGYAVTASGLTSNNYTITFVAGTLAVTPAPLAVTASDKSRVYGDANPTLDGTLTGLKNNDNITASYSTMATVASPVGTYAIVPALADSGQKLGNYTVTVTNGTLTVTAKALTITANNQSKTYGQTVTFTGTEFTTVGLVNGDTVTSVTLNSAGAPATATVAGAPYTITPSTAVGVGLTNYQITYVNGTLTVTPAPLTVTITSPQAGAVYAAGTPVPFAGNFTFTGPGSTFTVTWTFNSTLTTTKTVTSSNPGAADVGYTFTAAGVYYVQLTVTDPSGNYTSGTATQINSGGQLVNEYIVVYDPSAGFVTGGGWINSPAGAYAANPSLTGRANFGFVAKYQNGAKVPTGQTEFQFQAAGLNFHSTDYQWLVVSGAQAQYKGTGTINGVSGYSFMLTLTDGDLLGGGKPDLFRLKITDAAGNVVYDNMQGASDSMGNGQAIAGGSIQIKTK